MLEKSKAFGSFAVNDLDHAKHFYGHILGLNVTDNPMGILELHITGNQPTIIYPKPDHQPATFTILNFPVKNLEKTVDALIIKGVTFEQYTGQIQTNEKGISKSKHSPHIAWFKDPAGNILSLIEEG
ncbi:VOC family protein [Echinicola sp. CAU 1574]|uniref:VOC family protein n=1 Tax=Echinicola arenosa TaxID=2774144 RepID=A0ABR9AL64_9BACT|nr:VOC family protein [Echinicola arenosa]MBD8488645.1 VOC family protein [Echinicola arenosa]